MGISTKPKPERRENPSPIRREKEYRVHWEIELSAPNYIVAAKHALAIQRDPASLATVFSVTAVHDERDHGTVDLDAIE